VGVLDLRQIYTAAKSPYRSIFLDDDILYFLSTFHCKNTVARHASAACVDVPLFSSDVLLSNSDITIFEYVFLLCRAVILLYLSS
jgi:hypothetical protein